jgi:hypothetical protein
MVDAVRTGRDIQVLRINRGVGLHSTGEQVNLIGIACVRPAP